MRGPTLRTFCIPVASLVVIGVLILAGCQPSPSGARPVAPPAQKLVEEGELFLDQGLTNAALEAFNKALEQNPRLVRAHMGIGAAYRAREEYERAEQAYQTALKIEPNSFDARYYLGLCYQFLNRLDDAIRTYLQALTINPNSFEANRDLASAYLQKNLPGSALPYARNATRLRPEDQSAWANLAATYSLLERYEDAVDAYREAIELGDMHDAIVLGLADAHIRLGNFERAINTLEALLRQNPRSATAHERLGYAHYKKRQHEDALYHFRAALSIDSNDTAALNGLGVTLMTLYIQSGRVAANEAQRVEALSAWRRSLMIDDQQPHILELLSRYQKL